MIEPPHHMYPSLLWISHTNSNKTPKLKPNNLPFLPFSSFHSPFFLIHKPTIPCPFRPDDLPFSAPILTRPHYLRILSLHFFRLPFVPLIPTPKTVLCKTIAFSATLFVANHQLWRYTLFIFGNCGQRSNPLSKFFRIYTVNGINFVPNHNVCGIANFQTPKLLIDFSSWHEYFLRSNSLMWWFFFPATCYEWFCIF